MGKKILVAALLACVTTSGKAQFLNFEIEGHTSVSFMDYNTGLFRNLGVGNFKLSGAFSDIVEIYAFDPNGFAARSGYGNFDHFEFSFLFDNPPVSDPLDGVFRKGKGSGFNVGGYNNELTTHVLTVTRGRLFLTDTAPETWPYQFFEVGALVPEPATWAMLIAGFAMAGASMRRRKTTLSFG